MNSRSETKTINVFIGAIMMVAFITGCGSSKEGNDPSTFLGYQQTAYVADSFQLFADIQANNIEDFIAKKGPNQNATISDSELAVMINRVAGCFTLDKRILSSLIAQESAFKVTAESSTGAVGLTQMTKWGLIEVNDQLGRRGSSYAKPSTTQYFKNVAIKCATAGGSPWENLWDRASNMAEMKSILQQEPLTSVIYGAIYLKTALSVEKTASQGATMTALYRGALRRYNGDTKLRPGSTETEQEHYQRVIMKSAKNEFL